MLHNLAGVVAAILAIGGITILGTLLAASLLVPDDRTLTVPYLVANFLVSGTAAAVGALLVHRIARSRHAMLVGALAVVMVLLSVGGGSSGDGTADGTAGAKRPAWYPTAVLATGLVGLAAGHFIGRTRAAPSPSP